MSVALGIALRRTPLTMRMVDGRHSSLENSSPKSLCAPGLCPKGEQKTVTRLPPQILVVDDDVAVQEVLTLFLADVYKVWQVSTGAGALALVRREQIHLVVLDHRLPDRTGLDVLLELKSIRPDLPAIMLTGYGSEWICAAAFKLGISDYLPKPVNAVDLVTAVRRILSTSDENSEYEAGSAWRIGSPVPPCIPVQKVVGLIQKHYWDRLSLSRLAREVGMSKFRLSRRFREVIGVTFRDYLLRVRLERAKSLLANGRASITEVAQMVGFGDLPRFDKLFKRYTGFTPSAYRSSTSTCRNK